MDCALADRAVLREDALARVAESRAEYAPCWPGREDRHAEVGIGGRQLREHHAPVPLQHRAQLARWVQLSGRVIVMQVGGMPVKGGGEEDKRRN